MTGLRGGRDWPERGPWLAWGGRSPPAFAVPRGFSRRLSGGLSLRLLLRLTGGEGRARHHGTGKTVPSAPSGHCQGAVKRQCRRRREAPPLPHRRRRTSLAPRQRQPGHRAHSRLRPACLCGALPQGRRCRVVSLRGGFLASPVTGIPLLGSALSVESQWPRRRAAPPLPRRASGRRCRLPARAEGVEAPKPRRQIAKLRRQNRGAKSPN